MTHIDFRSVGYGIAVFFGVWLVLSILTTLVVSASDSGGAGNMWILVQIGGMSAPVFAGYVSALQARMGPIATGTVGGSLGAVPMLGLSAFFSLQLSALMLLAGVMTFVMLALLGAIVGKHRRKRGDR